MIYYKDSTRHCTSSTEHRVSLSTVTVVNVMEEEEQEVEEEGKAALCLHSVAQKPN